MHARPAFFIGVQSKVSQINSIIIRTTLCYQELVPILKTLLFRTMRAKFLTVVAGSLRFRIYVVSFLSLRHKSASTHALILRINLRSGPI